MPWIPFHSIQATGPARAATTVLVARMQRSAIRGSWRAHWLLQSVPGATSLLLMNPSPAIPGTGVSSGRPAVHIPVGRCPQTLCHRFFLVGRRQHFHVGPVAEDVEN